MAAKTLNIFLPMTGFLDTEISPAIKPTPQNKGQNVDTSLSLMAGTYGKSWVNTVDCIQDHAELLQLYLGMSMYKY